MGLFLKVLFMIFIAELGDKSQFLMIAMASKYKLRDILLGVFSSIFALNLIAITIGSVIGGFLPMTPINIAAGIAFLYFALTSIGGGDDGEEACERSGGRSAVLAIFGTFFLAELGDKTQIAALALAADGNHGGFDLLNSFLVFAGATLGLFAADLLGLLFGYFLGKKLPYGLFAGISFAIFSVFGIITLIDGFGGLFSGNEFYTIITTTSVGIVFAAVSLYRFFGSQKRLPAHAKK